jgi:hypothetical protein
MRYLRRTTRNLTGGPMSNAATHAERGVVDYGEDRICTSMDELGFHMFDLEALPWETPKGQGRIKGQAELVPEGVVKEKWLVRSDETRDRMPVSVIQFPPNYRFPRHWHTHGEFIVVLKGTAIFAGHELKPGDMAYNDSRTVYGSEMAGPDGVEFLMIRRAASANTVVGA